jgi:hypothetical protein
MIQSFPMDGYYRTDIISGVGHLGSNLVVPLMLCTVRCVMARASALYYKSLGTASTLLKKDNISGKLYY